MKNDYTNELHEHYHDRTHASAGIIVPMVLDDLNVHSVMDVGCGHGVWLTLFSQHGVSNLAGIDGDYIQASDLLRQDINFQNMDLNAPEIGAVSEAYDLVISLEVAEHLQPSSSESFVDFLCSMSSAALFSAGIPGQRGDHHVNCRPHAYWKELFASRGYNAFDPYRVRMWHEEDVMLCYRQNMFLFVKEGSDVIKAGRSLPRASCLTLIDEGLMEYRNSWKQTLKMAFYRALNKYI